jgi:DNA-binding transcriptional LysR family regulator
MIRFSAFAEFWLLIMELRDLRYFVTVAEHRNIGRAAESLDLSATALGKSLRRLERNVGAKLVQHARGGVALTAVGAALLDRIGPLQGMLNDVCHEAADLAQGRAGHIHVGAAFGAPENMVAEACVSLANESSSITLKVSAFPNPDLSNWLHKGELDFCVTGPQSFSASEFVREVLYDDPFVVLASANHRLAKNKHVSIADIADERWASVSIIFNRHWQALVQAFEHYGLPLPILALETNSHAVRMQAIAYSKYLGITTRQFLRQEALRYPLVELPVKEMSLVRPTAIIYRKGAYLSPAALRLIEILKAKAKNNTDGVPVVQTE